MIFWPKGLYWLLISLLYNQSVRSKGWFRREQPVGLRVGDWLPWTDCASQVGRRALEKARATVRAQSARNHPHAQRASGCGSKMIRESSQRLAILLSPLKASACLLGARNDRMCASAICAKRRGKNETASIYKPCCCHETGLKPVLLLPTLGNKKWETRQKCVKFCQISTKKPRKQEKNGWFYTVWPSPNWVKSYNTFYCGAWSMLLLPFYTFACVDTLLLAFACLCLCLLAFAGIHWHLLAFAGICRCLLAYAGVCSLLLAFAIFCSWQLPSACICFHLLAFACICLHLPAFACICLHLLAFACICLHLPAFTNKAKGINLAAVMKPVWNWSCYFIKIVYPHSLSDDSPPLM